MANVSIITFLKDAPGYLKARIFILLSVVLAVLIVGLGSIAWIINLRREPALTEKVLEHSRKTASTVAQEYTFTYEIKDMSMAFINKKGSRTAYAQFTILFDCPDEESKHVMEMNRAKIITGIFEAGGDIYIEDLTAPLAAQGFEKFKSQVKIKLTEYFKSKGPRNVLIKEWVMN